MKFKIIYAILTVLFIIVSVTLYKTDKKYSAVKKDLKLKEIIISDQLAYINNNNINHEILTKNKLEDIVFFKNKELNKNIFNSKRNIKIYKNNNQIVRGINNFYPGSAFLGIYNDNLYIISATGMIGFQKINTNHNITFKQIKNNINDFIGQSKLNKGNWFSVKDLLVFDGKIFVSFTNEIEIDCWNTSIIFADLNFTNLQFEYLFKSKDCVNSKNNIDNEFNAHQSGGRIIGFNDNIIFSTGDFRLRNHAQQKKTSLGKIIRMNFKNLDKNKYEILSLGHRNPQGLLFDEKNNYIISTEHGPNGGDEINLNSDPFKKQKNFGWPVSSYGEHYGGGKNSEKNQKKYIKYPLNKSHKQFGFEEPIKYFVPSIGISEIINIGEEKYLVSSLKDKAIYSFEIDNKKMTNLKRIEIGERIRDFIFDKKRKKAYLFLEDTASIGVINFE
jgi:hypothetical protein